MTAYTVTATATNNTFGGGLLQVDVLDNAAVAGSPAVASSSTAFNASITTSTAGSFVFGALANETASTTFVASASSTIISQASINSGGAQGGSFQTTSATGTPGPTTVGSSTAFPGTYGVAAVEILASGGTLSVDASSPAVVDSATASSFTTASFSPPAGTVLVAMLAITGNFTPATCVATVSSSPALTWTEQVKVIVSESGTASYVGVWTASVPGGAGAGEPSEQWQVANRRRNRRQDIWPGAYQAPIISPGVPTAYREWRRPGRIPPRSSVATPLAGGISQPPIIPKAIRDQERDPKVPPRSNIASWMKGISQPPIPPTAIRDIRKPPRIPRSLAGWTQGVSQPPIPPTAVRASRKPWLPRHGSSEGIPQPPGTITPAVPLPASQHASRRPKLPVRGSSEIPLAGGVSQPPIPPTSIRDVRKPPRIPRSVAEWTKGISQPTIPPTSVRAWRRPLRFPLHGEGSPPSAGFTPPLVAKAPNPGQVRERIVALTRWRRNSTPTLPIVPPTLNPQSIRDVRKPPRIPRSSESKYPGAISQPPIPPTSVHASRRPNRIPRSEISPPFVPPPAVPVPHSVSVPRRVFLFLLKRVRPSAPPGPSTFVISPGQVFVTDVAVFTVALSNVLADSVVVTDILAGTVIIGNGQAGSITVSNNLAGSVSVGNLT
jgi:hypothetical protein